VVHSGGGGTRTPKGVLNPPHFECGALPVRATPPRSVPGFRSTIYPIGAARMGLRCWRTFARLRSLPSVAHSGSNLRFSSGRATGVDHLPNRGARIRTGDLCDPNAALYRTEPRPETNVTNGRGGIGFADPPLRPRYFFMTTDGVGFEPTRA
jgi:hypothetical protein